MSKKKFTEEDVVKLLGIKVKSIGGEINKINGHGTTKSEREWYVISRIDNIYTLISELKSESEKNLSNHITDSEKRFITKEHTYKLIGCVLSAAAILMMWLTS